MCMDSMTISGKARIYLQSLNGPVSFVYNTFDTVILCIQFTMFVFVETGIISVVALSTWFEKHFINNHDSK
jgi:hypothetical protein